MAFIAAKCPACGGEIQLDDLKESGFCMYCGGKVLLEQAIPQKVVIEGLATLEVKLKNAEAYAKLGKHKEAYEVFKGLTEEFTNDYRPWWGCAKTNSQYSNYYSEYVYFDTIKGCDAMQSALRLANNAQRNTIEQEYTSYRERIRLTNEHTANIITRVKETNDYSSFNHLSTKRMVRWEENGPESESIMGYEIINGQLYEFEPQTDIQAKRLTGKFHFTKVKGITDNRLVTQDKSMMFLLEQIVAICDAAVVTAMIDVDTRDGKRKVIFDRVYDKSSVTLPEVEDSIELFKKGQGPTDKINSSSGGCYIATAVYGSYDAPQVMVLRSFRDNTLAHSIFGRLFIRAYYTFSPPVASRLKGAKRTNAFVRRILDRWVAKLKNEQADA